MCQGINTLGAAYSKDKWKLEDDIPRFFPRWWAHPEICFTPISLSRTPVGSWPVNVSSEELAHRFCTGFLLFPLSLPHALPGASTLPSRNHMLESPCLLVCFLGDQPKILDDWGTSKRKTLHSMLSFSLILNHKNVLVKIN